MPPLPARIEKVHIVGVCGTAMGSLAAMLKERGLQVRGSDQMAYPPMSDWLSERGIEIMRGYKAENLSWDPDLVVIGNVIRRTYADAEETERRALPAISLPEALRHFFLKGKRPLVVSGTHGKTTTTSMLAWILHEAGADPSFFVGGVTGNFDSNYRLGAGGAFAIEGDEYDTAYFDKVPKFWHYAPERAVVNNLEFDHADIYPDLDAIESVFRRFVALIPPKGSLWVNGDDERALALAESCRAPTRTFGLTKTCALRATEIAPTKEGMRARVLLEGRDLGLFELSALGEFNVRNMLGAMALALDEGVDPEQCRNALRRFRSVRRRQEIVGVARGVLVLDDFAHHPSAVRATLEAVRARFSDRRVRAVFETKSNTSRRRVFQDAYPNAFAPADRVVLSRPWKKDDLPPEQLIDLAQMRDDIARKVDEAIVLDDVEAIVEHVAARARPDDVIVGLSGSSFDGFHRKMLDALERGD